jgi:hypothetical protein
MALKFHSLRAPPPRAPSGDDFDHILWENLLIIFIEDLGARLAPQTHPILQGIDAPLGDDVKGETPTIGGFSDVKNLLTGIVVTGYTLRR